MTVLQGETHNTHTHTYSFNKLTETSKKDNYGDKMFKLKQLIEMFWANFSASAEEAKKVAAAKKKKKEHEFSPQRFVEWLGTHWRELNEMPGTPKVTPQQFC